MRRKLRPWNRPTVRKCSPAETHFSVKRFLKL